jgi:hypothetical protein
MNIKQEEVRRRRSRAEAERLAMEYEVSGLAGRRFARSIGYRYPR